MPENRTVYSSGVGFAGLLTILFIGLKLGGIIDWHWAWVLSPLWLGIASSLFFGIIIMFILWFAVKVESKKIRKKIKESKPDDKETTQRFNLN